MGLGSGIRDPGVKKAPDPGSGSATLLVNCLANGGISKNLGYDVCFVFTPAPSTLRKKMRIRIK
jgi:hypothetical protein